MPERFADYPHRMAASTPNTPVSGQHVPVPSDVRAPRRTPPSEETSAGGLVVDRNASPPCAALIGRLDRRGRLMWSLPKGHVEPGGQLSADDAEVVEVEWVPLADVSSRLAYADERRLMESVPQLLADYG